MSDMHRAGKQPGKLPPLLFWPLIMISTLTVATAYVFAYQLSKLPKENVFDIPRLVSALFFTKGLGLGLLGSTVALNSPSPKREYALSAVIGGAGLMLFALVAGHSIEHQMMGGNLSNAPEIVLLATLVLVLLVTIPACVRHRAKQKAIQEEARQD